MNPNAPLDKSIPILSRLPRMGLIVIPLVVLMLELYIDTWRLACVGLCLVSLLTLEVWRWAQGDLAPVQMTPLAVVPLLLILASGGLQSPVVLVLIPLAMLSGFILEERSLISFAIWLPFIWGLVIVDPGSWAGGAFVPVSLGPPRPMMGTLVWAILLSLAMVAGNAFSRHIRGLLSDEHHQTLNAQRTATHAMHQRKEDLVALSGSIAHELKNPLTAVYSLTSFMQRRAEPHSAEREQLDVMMAEMERMRSTLTDFLNLSRPVDRLTFKAHRLDWLVEEVVSVHRALVMEQGVWMAVVAPSVTARIDRRKIAQVIENLLQNALQASVAGDHVNVGVHANGHNVRVTVRDTGPGLPPGNAERLFSPGVTTRNAGSGLGLAVCRVIAEQHGGTIELNNHAEGGCEATLTLPYSKETM